MSGDALGQRVSNMDGTHLMALVGHPRVDVVAGSSRGVGRRQRFAERAGCKTYADWHDLIEKEPLDLVSSVSFLFSLCSR